MSTYQIDIDDDVLCEQISRMINVNVSRILQNQLHISTGLVADAAKEIVYSKKDEIINAVVERATREIVKKGLPKLIESFSEGEK